MFKRNFLLIALVMALMAGCAGLDIPRLSTNLDRLGVTEKAATAAADTANQFYGAGAISRATLVEVRNIQREIAPLLDLAHEALATPDDFPAILVKINELILRMQKEVL